MNYLRTTILASLLVFRLEAGPSDYQVAAIKGHQATYSSRFGFINELAPTIPFQTR